MVSMAFVGSPSASLENNKVKNEEDQEECDICQPKRCPKTAATAGTGEGLAEFCESMCEAELAIVKLEKRKLEFKQHRHEYHRKERAA